MHPFANPKRFWISGAESAAVEFLKREHSDVLHFHLHAALDGAAGSRRFAAGALVTHPWINTHRPQSKILRAVPVQRGSIALLRRNLGSAFADSLAAAGVIVLCVAIVRARGFARSFRLPHHHADERTRARARFGIGELRDCDRCGGCPRTAKGLRNPIEAIAALRTPTSVRKCPYFAGDVIDRFPRGSQTTCCGLGVAGQ